MNLDILLNKKNDDTLNAEEQQLVAEIKDYVYKLINNEKVDEYNYDKAYAYAKLAKFGIIKDKKKTIDFIFESILYNGLFDYDVDTLFKTYPILLEYVDNVLDALNLDQLEALCSYYWSKEDYNKYFKITNIGANYELQGLLGGFKLVNTLIKIDSFKFGLACCYIEGKGTKPNYAKAFKLLLEYRRDHLVYKNGSDNLSDELLSILYNNLKSDYEAGKKYPGLFYSLAVMNREGIGTNYNPTEYKRYAELGSDYNMHRTDLTMDEYLYSRLMWQYVNDHTINNDINGELIDNLCTLDNIKVGKVIELGKYDHRSVLWKVLDIKKGKALLLCTNVLDNAYPILNNVNAIEDTLEHFKYQIRFDNNIKFELKYLTKAEINKYLTEADKLCFSRKQAKTNGTEGYGVKVDETTGFAAWHTATKINKEDPFMYYVDTNGSFNDCWCGAEYVGFRPAMWLDLTKEDE